MGVGTMKALIITDGTESIKSAALLIKETLTGFKSDICQAKDFIGNELLSSDVFFIGCEDPSPSSFAFLEQMLSHINLSPRKCGIFSNKDKTNKYLKKILKDCEAVISEPLLFNKDTLNKKTLNKWLKDFKK